MLSILQPIRHNFKQPYPYSEAPEQNNDNIYVFQVKKELYKNL